jgi:predicted ATPase
VVSPALASGDLEEAERLSAKLVAYCVEKRVEPWRLVGSKCYALARATREATQENIAAYRDAIDAHHRAGGRFGTSANLSALAEIMLTVGDVIGAEAALQEAFIFIEQSGERNWLAEVHRVDGRIALKQPEPDRVRAEACFLQAIEVARNQEARIAELRAATDLARLWRDTAARKDPRGLLEPILTMIEGGEAMPVVRRARALLANVI